MINLGSWMNGILIGWGVDPKIANTFDEMIIAALLVILAIGLDYLCQAIFVGSMKKLAQHTHYQWDSYLGLCLVASGVYTGERFVAFVSENMCCVYRVRFVIGDKWFYFSVPRYV